MDPLFPHEWETVEHLWIPRLCAIVPILLTVAQAPQCRAQVQWRRVDDVRAYYLLRPPAPHLQAKERHSVSGADPQNLVPDLGWRWIRQKSQTDAGAQEREGCDR
jgi:hypothetical protein